MSTVTYCDHGHLWDRASGQRCDQCAQEAQEPALKVIQEIADLLPYSTPDVVRAKLRVLREMLTD